MVFRTCQHWSKILILAKMTLKDVDVKVIAATAVAAARRNSVFSIIIFLLYCLPQSFNNTAVVVVVRLSTGFER